MAKTYDELIAEIETFESGVKNRATKLRNILTYIAETATTLNPNFWRNTAGTTTNYTTTTIIGQEELTSLPIFLIIFPHATNTGASTIKIDSNSPVALKRLDGTTLQAGDLIYNRPFLIIKDNIGEYRLVRESTDMIFPSIITTSVDATDYIPIQQSGVSKKATKETLFTYPTINKGLQVYDNVGNGVYIEDNGGTGVYIESKATGGGINIRCFNSNGVNIVSNGDITNEAGQATLVIGVNSKFYDFRTIKKGIEEAGVYPLSGKTGQSYLTKDQVSELVSGAGGTWGSITGTLSDQTDLQTALNSKENSITSGTTSQYYRGDKSWADFADTVRATLLTGLSTATNAVINATDSVLSALGKLQKQITDLTSTVNTNTTAIGTLSSLSTLDKTNIVSAINENTARLDVADNDQQTLKLYKASNFRGF